MPAAVILAAGRGERLGGANKALLVDGEASFLARVAGCARAAGVDELVVVVGLPHAAATAAEARRLGLAVALNHEPGRGMGSSVAIGFAAAAGFAAEVALLWPVDHPRVRPGTVSALLARAAAELWVEPVHDGRGGHPAAVGRAWWPALVACAARPGGARAVRDEDPARVVRLPVADPGVVRDVDLPADRA